MGGKPSKSQLELNHRANARRCCYCFRIRTSVLLLLVFSFIFLAVLCFNYLTKPNPADHNSHLFFIAICLLGFDGITDLIGGIGVTLHKMLITKILTAIILIKVIVNLAFFLNVGNTNPFRQSWQYPLYITYIAINAANIVCVYLYYRALRDIFLDPQTMASQSLPVPGVLPQQMQQQHNGMVNVTIQQNFQNQGGSHGQLIQQPMQQPYAPQHPQQQYQQPYGQPYGQPMQPNMPYNGQYGPQPQQYQQYPPNGQYMQQYPPQNQQYQQVPRQSNTPQPHTTQMTQMAAAHVPSQSKDENAPNNTNNTSNTNHENVAMSANNPFNNDTRPHTDTVVVHDRNNSNNSNHRSNSIVQNRDNRNLGSIVGEVSNNKVINRNDTAQTHDSNYSIGDEQVVQDMVKTQSDNVVTQGNGQIAKISLMNVNAAQSGVINEATESKVSDNAYRIGNVEHIHSIFPDQRNDNLELQYAKDEYGNVVTVTKMGPGMELGKKRNDIHNPNAVQQRIHAVNNSGHYNSKNNKLENFEILNMARETNASVVNNNNNNKEDSTSEVFEGVDEPRANAISVVADLPVFNSGKNQYKKGNSNLMSYGYGNNGNNLSTSDVIATQQSMGGGDYPPLPNQLSTDSLYRTGTEIEGYSRENVVVGATNDKNGGNMNGINGKNDEFHVEHGMGGDPSVTGGNVIALEMVNGPETGNIGGAIVNNGNNVNNGNQGRGRKKTVDDVYADGMDMDGYGDPYVTGGAPGGGGGGGNHSKKGDNKSTYE